MSGEPCRICGRPSEAIGVQRGRWRAKEYRWARCPACSFAFVANPDLDFSAIYDDAYYAGRGADEFIDYAFELDHPDETIRRLEWRGLLEIVRSLTHLDAHTRWLDFGCGNGGLVRHVQQASGCQIVGFEEGAIAARAAQRGIPILSKAELAGAVGKFDVVTAVEVLEHVRDPIASLTEIFHLVKEPGLFFFTTGNSAPFRERITRWGYAVPEIHISLYEPSCMDLALRKAGFSVMYPGYVSGYTDVIAYKVLKRLRVQRYHPALSMLPWGFLGRVIDWRLGVTRFPVGVKGSLPAYASRGRIREARVR